MNEHDFFKQMIHDRAVDDALVKAKAKQKTHSTFAWKKAATIAAAAAAVLIGTVFLIPSARAEVLSWFGATRPEEYLMTDPEERTPVDALNILIVPPVTAVSEPPVRRSRAPLRSPFVSGHIRSRAGMLFG